MKQLLSILLVCTIAVVTVGCVNNTNESTPDESTVQTTTESVSEDYPQAQATMTEKSEIDTGLRYTFNLKEFTEMFNQMGKDIGNSEDLLDYSVWEELSDDVQEGTGVKLKSYIYNSSLVALMAITEAESGKITSIGIGTTVAKFLDNEDNAMGMSIYLSAIMAVTVGGYNEEDTEFFYDLFYNTIYDKPSYWYNNSVYLRKVDEQENDTTGENSTIMFFVSPAADNILADWELTDYASVDREALKEQIKNSANGTETTTEAAATAKAE